MARSEGWLSNCCVRIIDSDAQTFAVRNADFSTLKDGEKSILSRIVSETLARALPSQQQGTYTWT
jgi:hypothetical protein